MEEKKKKTKYLAFCNSCGLPAVVPLYIIRTYWSLTAVKGYYCEHCTHYNEIPDYFKILHNDL